MGSVSSIHPNGAFSAKAMAHWLMSNDVAYGEASLYPTSRPTDQHTQLLAHSFCAFRVYGGGGVLQNFQDFTRSSPQR